MKTPENMFDLKQIKFAVECLTCWSGSVDETLDESIAMNTIYYALQIAKEIAEGKAFVCRVEDIAKAPCDKDFIGIGCDFGDVFYHAKYSKENDKHFSYGASDPEGLRWTHDAGFGTHYLTFNGSPTLPTIKENE